MRSAPSTCCQRAGLLRARPDTEAASRGTWAQPRRLGRTHGPEQADAHRPRTGTQLRHPQKLASDCAGAGCPSDRTAHGHRHGPLERGRSPPSARAQLAEEGFRIGVDDSEAGGPPRSLSYGHPSAERAGREDRGARVATQRWALRSSRLRAVPCYASSLRVGPSSGPLPFRRTGRRHRSQKSP
jgi:hypothetical protein